MKKFMFSAVALVAFSFAGMANNSVEKTTKEEKEVEAVKATDCYQWASDASMDELMAYDHGSPSMGELMDIYDFYLGFCKDLGGNVGDMVVVSN
ncbi:hypothetical protein [Flavobacterium sp. HNIBRBA15423]|uniref:hypothetical protein n=1 Tax=Flavobacterium sp. HNIBRBA15423 TaxID=3458683 RepID=UPI004043C0A4